MYLQASYLSTLLNIFLEPTEAASGVVPEAPQELLLVHGCKENGLPSQDP